MAIQAELRLGIRDFNANLDRATQAVRQKAGEMKRESSGVGTSLADGIKGVLPALSFAAIGAGIKAAFNQADDIADLSLKLQESAESIQKVDYAAQLAGSNVDQVADAMIKLERALGDVENKKAAEALANLGFSADELARMSLDEKMIALSDAFEKARASGTGVNDIQALLGRSSAELIPLLEQGGEALRGMFEDAPVLAEATVQEMAKINDEIDAIIMRGKGMFAGIVGEWTKATQFGADFIGNLMGGSSAGDAWTEAIGQGFDRKYEAEKDAEERAAEREQQGEAQAEAAEAAALRKEAADEELKMLKEADELEKQILDRRKKAADERKKREEDLTKAREQAEAGGFALLDPEAQAARLREQLEGALGLKVGSSADLERGLATQRQAVADAKASGDTEAEMAALDRLNESQQLAKEFTDAAQDLAPEAPAGGVGSLAGLVNQMFGRDPQAQQVEELRNLGSLAAQQRDRLDGIIKKMDEQPPVTLFGGF